MKMRGLCWRAFQDSAPTVFPITPETDPVIGSVSLMRKLARGHQASKWKSQDLNPETCPLDKDSLGAQTPGN